LDFGAGAGDMGDEQAGYPCWVDFIAFRIVGRRSELSSVGKRWVCVPCVTKEVRRNAGGIEMQGDLVLEAVLPAVQCRELLDGTTDVGIRLQTCS
jgi:hypothetical protein